MILMNTSFRFGRWRSLRITQIMLMLLDSEREGGPGVIYAPKFSVKSVFNAILPMSAMPPEKLRRCKHEK